MKEPMAKESIHPFRTLFIVDGALDRPLLHSQGIPLLRRFSEKGMDCSVLSFEDSKESIEGRLGQELAAKRIVWLPVIIAKASSSRQRILVVLSGFVRSFKLCWRRRINVVHCRSYRPAFIGSLLKLFMGSGFLFDMRGFLIDELVADGRWNGTGLKYRIAKRVEQFLILSADAITVTSPQFKEIVLSLPYFPASRADKVITIPNCADVNRFSLVDAERRRILREKLGWDGRLVAVFAGDAIRYRDTLDEIISFFDVLKSARPDAYLVLAVTGNPDNMNPERLLMLGRQSFKVVSVPPQDMPDYLAAADIGLSFLKNKNFSIAITSPIKFAEYLSCGLPVVINPGIGDTGRIIEQYKVGVVIDRQKPEQVKSGVSALLEMIATDPDLRQHCHETAEQELSLDLSVERYAAVYQEVAKASRRH